MPQHRLSFPAVNGTPTILWVSFTFRWPLYADPEGTSNHRSTSTAHDPRIADCPWQLPRTYEPPSVAFWAMICGPRLPLSISVLWALPLGRGWHLFVENDLAARLPTVTTHPICECAQNRLFYPPREGSKFSPLALSPTFTLKTPFHGALWVCIDLPLLLQARGCRFAPL